MMNLFSKPVICLYVFGLAPFALNIYAQDQPPEQTPPALDAATEEALMLYAQALVALKTERPESALELLRQAVLLKPLNADYRHKLAQAYEQVGKPVNRWFQLRQAVRLDPNHQPAVGDFLAAWRFAEQRGAFDVGNEEAFVESVLGEADVKQEENNESFWQYGFMSLQFVDNKLNAVFDMRDMGVAMAQARESVVFELDESTWKAKKRQIGQLESIVEYVPVESRPYKEMVMIHRLVGIKNETSPRSIMQRQQESLQKLLPQVKWNVIEEDDSHVLYEWWSDLENQAQYEITHVMAGESDIHRLVYSAKKAPLEPAKREHWLKLMSEASLTKTQ